MPPFATLQEALAARAASPHAVHFIAGEAEERRVGYAELHARALTVLGELQRRGVCERTPVILLCDALEPFVDAFWACVLGGMPAVPLATGTTEQHRHKFLKVLERLDEPWVLAERRAFARIEQAAAEAGHAAALARLASRVLYVEDLASDAAPGRTAVAKPGDVAFIQFSSGSTSAPKGVVLTHRNLMTNIAAILEGIGGAHEGDSSLSWMPLTHDMGLIGFHLAPVCAGASHWLMPAPLFVRRPSLWMQKASEHRVSVTCSPNFGYQHYLRSFDAAQAATLDLSQLRVVFNGAEPISATLCRDFAKALAPAGLDPDVMLPVYGLAEASLAVTFPPMRRPLETVRLARGRLGVGQRAERVDAGSEGGVEHVKVGTPVQDCELRVAGDDHRALADGTVGHVLIRGGGVTRGYYGDDALTQATIDGEGWLDTGDLGAIVDGELVVTGRAKELILVAGQNLYPPDLEELVARHGGIEAGRVAIAGVRARDGVSDEVIAFIHHRGADAASFVPVAQAVRRALSTHAGIAARAVVPMRQLPKTTSGKLQRFALAEAFERGDYTGVLLELAACEAQGGDASVASAIERDLLEICRAELPGKRIEPEDNLFELGTSSLALAKIYERVDAAWPGRLEVTDFFDYPTVRAMALHLAEREGATA